MKFKLKSAHVQLLLIAAVFVTPVLLAAWLAGGRGPELTGATVNQGQLISPPVAVGAALSGLEWGGVPGYWRALVLSEGECSRPCRAALQTLVRLREGLGRKGDRLQAMLVIASSAVVSDAAGVDVVPVGRSGLAMLRERLATRLAPELLTDGAVFLLDWRGDLMMVYPPGSGPAPIAKDLQRLFKTLRVD